MHRTSKHAVLRAVIAMTVATAVAIAWAGTALASTPSTGTLELCKSSLNGMSGRSFSFSVNGGAPITVKGGRCTGPMSVAAGNVTILEDQSDPATDVASIRATPSARIVSTDLANRKIVVSVPVGTTAANETRVTYVNEPAGGNYGDLKICKLTETPAFLGRDFSFKVNGGSAISVTAADAFDDPSTWSCRLAGHFQVGSVVSVQELTPPEAEVAWIDTDPAANLVDFDTNAATATVQIGAGMTVVEFDNEAHTPQGSGYLEICKDRAQIGYNQVDWAVQGTFTFTVEDASGASQDVQVLAGQCSAPLQVAAGIAHVTEQAVDGIDLVDAYTIPDDRLMGVNLINKTADVEVPVSSDPNDETQLHMVNQAQRAQLKICKALGPGSSDLIGQKFYFDVDAGNGMWLDGNRYPFSITAGAQTQCKIWGDLPIGTDVSVDELFQGDLMKVSGLTPLTLADLPNGDFIDTTGEGTITMKPGINTLTVTNTAKGQLEVCKKEIRGLKLQPYFNFLVDGSTKVKVQAGKCSLPLRVSVGNHTVVEQSYDTWLGNPGQNMSSSSSIFELDSGLTEEGTFDPGIYVYPPDRQVALNSNTRTVTVSVPYGPNGGETVVTYKNRIKKARLKVCKVIPATSYDSLHGKLWTYSVAFKNDGTYTTDPITDGECTYLTRDFPIVQGDGSRTEITITEQPTPYPTDPAAHFVVSDINVQFAYDWTPNLSTGVVVLHPGPGVNVVTYTNQSIDP